MSTVKKKSAASKHSLSTGIIFPCPISALQLLTQLNSFVTTDSYNELNKEQKNHFFGFVFPGFCLPGCKNVDQQTKTTDFTTLFKNHG